jgi:hypothetical protein
VTGQQPGDLRHQAGIHRRGRVRGDDRGFSRRGQPEGDSRPAAESCHAAPEQFGQGSVGCRGVLADGLADRELQQRGR